MNAWTTNMNHMRITMQTRGAHSNNVATTTATTITSRVSKWTDALVDRFVCCGGRHAIFDEDDEDKSEQPEEAHEKEPQDATAPVHDAGEDKVRDDCEEGEKVNEEEATVDDRTTQDGNSVGNNAGNGDGDGSNELNAEPATSGALDGKDEDNDSAVIDSVDAIAKRMDLLGGGASGRQSATNMSNECPRHADDASHAMPPPTTPPTEETTTLDSSIDDARLPVAVPRDHDKSAHVAAPPVPRSNETHAITRHGPQPQRLSRLRPPQVHPHQLASRAPGSAYQSTEPTRSSLATPPVDKSTKTTTPKVDSIRTSDSRSRRRSRSPSSSVSSTDSCDSFGSSTISWRNAHSDLVAENMMMRQRLDATQPRVYDFEKDPRFRSEQQTRKQRQQGRERWSRPE